MENLQAVRIQFPDGRTAVIFDETERATIEMAITHYYGQWPDQAIVDQILATLAETKILSIGLLRVLHGESAVGLSASGEIVFRSSGAVTTPPS